MLYLEMAVDCGHCVRKLFIQMFSVNGPLIPASSLPLLILPCIYSSRSHWNIIECLIGAVTTSIISGYIPLTD